MKFVSATTLVLLACAAVAPAQITMLPQMAPGSPPPATFVSPQIMDFDTVGAQPPPPPGTVGSQDPYFLSFGLCEVAIVNAPGAHVVAGDTLSSGFFGNCLASVNNQLAIVAPGGAMDNHSVGAGWRLVLAPGTVATQFGALITDQVNHPMAVETWLGGIMQNTLTFTMSGTGAFPNPHIYFEDLGGFDEVRFMNTTAAGGWGIDDFTLANVQGVPGPCGVLPPPPYQPNSAEAGLTISGAPDSGVYSSIVVASGLNTPETLDLSSVNVGLPHDIGITYGAMTVPLGFITPGNQVVNIDIANPTFSFLYGGTAALNPVAPFPAPMYQVPFSVSAPFIASTQMVVSDPASAIGLTLSHAADYAASACSLAVGFEGLTPGSGAAAGAGPYPVGWGNGTGGTAQWQVRSGTTTSGGTGPVTGAFTGSNYMYCETSVPNSPGGIFVMDTCLYDLLQLSTFDVSFRLSRIGATIGTLNVYMDDGSGTFSTLVTSYTGPEPTSTDWTLETFSLVPILPATNQAAFRFEYTAGTSFTGDIAIDDFLLQ